MLVACKLKTLMCPHLKKTEPWLGSRLTSQWLSWNNVPLKPKFHLVLLPSAGVKVPLFPITWLLFKNQNTVIGKQNGKSNYRLIEM